MHFGDLTESQIELQILHWLKTKPHSLAIKIPTTGYFDAKTKRFRRQQNPYALSGHPDILLVYKGHYFGIEVKSKKGKQSESQKEMERLIRKAQGQYILVHSLDELIDQLEPLLSGIDLMMDEACIYPE